MKLRFVNYRFNFQLISRKNEKFSGKFFTLGYNLIKEATILSVRYFVFLLNENLISILLINCEFLIEVISGTILIGSIF